MDRTACRLMIAVALVLASALPAFAEDPPAISSDVKTEAKRDDPITGLCVLGGPLLCLRDGRFRVQVEWRDFEGNTGEARSVKLTPEGGYFWFFDPDQPELLVKVLDGRAVNGYYWFFFGSLTNVEFTVYVTEIFSREERVYHNPLGRFASTGDILAFAGETSCRALGGIPCPDGTFCDFPAGQCRVANPVGLCVRPPDACPEIYQPVCGCDGKTYSNDCERLRAGVGLDHEGECAP